MAHAVAIAADPARQAADEIDEYEDDQDGPKRHGILPDGRRTALISRTVRREKHIPPSGSITEPGAGGTLSRLEVQRRGVDAVAQAGRRRPVGEDVAEMAAALGAQHLGADHAV